MEILIEVSISLFFNVDDLFKSKRPLIEVNYNIQRILEDVSAKLLPPTVQLQEEKILEFEVKKSTRHRLYMEHLI